MPDPIDALLETPSPAAWRELRHRWTRLPAGEHRVEAWDAALASWPDAWRVAAPGWLPVASLGRAWKMPPRDEWDSPLLRLARALDFGAGRAVAPSDRVLEALREVDLSRVTRVRHRERAPFLMPNERILAKLLRSGAYRSVTHLGIEWPTRDELRALATLPALQEIEFMGHEFSQEKRGLPAAAEVAEGLAALGGLFALRAPPAVWEAVRRTPLFERLRRGLEYNNSAGLPAPGPTAYPRPIVSEFLAQTGLVPRARLGERPPPHHSLSVSAPPPPAPIAADADTLTVFTGIKIPPKVAKEWARVDLTALPMATLRVDLKKQQALPTPVPAPSHLVLCEPTALDPLFGPGGAAVRVLELRGEPFNPHLWTADEVRAVLDRVGGTLEAFVLGGTQMTPAEFATTLRHPALRELRALCVDEGCHMKAGRKFQQRPRITLDADFTAALASLPALRWLRLQHLEFTPEALRGLYLPALFGLDVDLTSARALGDVMGLITPELEWLTTLHLQSVRRTGDELVHVPSGPHLEHVQLGMMPSHEDDAESLDYSVGGVLADRAVPPGGTWLDEPG